MDNDIERDVFGQPVHSPAEKTATKDTQEKDAPAAEPAKKDLKGGKEPKEQKGQKKTAAPKAPKTNPDPVMRRIRRISASLKVRMSGDPQMYHFWSLDKLLEALKPALDEEAITLYFSDEVRTVGRFNYVVATCTAVTDDGQSVSVQAVAREDDSSDEGNYFPQLSGAATTYAHKYAIRNLFLPSAEKDDPDDPDTKRVSKGWYPGENAPKTEERPSDRKPGGEPPVETSGKPAQGTKRELTPEEYRMKLGMWVRKQKDLGTKDERILDIIRHDPRIALPDFTDEDYEKLLADFSLQKDRPLTNVNR